MIRSHSVVIGPDYVKLVWPVPKFPPIRYQLNYMVTKKPTCGTNHSTDNDTITKAKNLSSKTTFVIILNFCVSSKSMVNLLAVYNPASIDKGIVITGTPFNDQTKKMKSG